MTIVTDVMSDVITGVSSGVLDLNGTRERYTFDIADSMHATIPEWTPLNAVFSYGADVVVDVAATGSQQRIVSGATGVGDHTIAITGVGSVAVVYRDTSGTSRAVIGDPITSGVSQHVEAKYYTDRVELWQDGVLTDTEMQPPELAALSRIAASPTPNLYFGGTVSNVFCTSTSPIQNVNVMAGNGTDRYASFPATDSMDNWKFTCWFNTASTAALQMLLGVTPSTASLIRLTNVNTSPVITVKMNSTTVNIDAASIVVGQDHKLVVEKIGTTVTVYVDDVQTGTTTNAAWTTGTVFDVIGALGDTTQVFGGIISYAEIKDLVTGITHTYNNTDNYESGGVVILPDSTGGQDGTWVNAVIGDLEYLPRTDRRYRIDEGGGATIFDSRGLPAQDGTIVNEDDANWNRS